MAETLGLIAGSGRLPFEVAEAARESGLDLAVLAIEANTDPAIESFATRGFTSIAVGELQRLIDFFKQAGPAEVILAGAVAKLDGVKDLASLRLDARALGLLAKLEHRGDDALLRAIAGELESEGLAVVDSTKYLGARMTAEGLVAGGPLDERVTADLRLAMRVAKALGRQDVGQSAAVREGTVLAVEAIEGTDEMMRRAAGLAGPGAVVVKAAKPGQDLRFDVPVIGRSTVELARELGFVAIGLEVGATLILEREPTCKAAESAGIAIVGLTPEPA
ncbi:MAG: UDP-2,3-diacylglucosamine diphosphatase LpxI [Deltaproteobacteria bacterium]|nr:UDP-2,3-diacylglucosamine diphosphatase LpxI [Deltaproteobacteria bacterium]MBW2414460.1 UDP-2,3-diacylglucosamine diphosphatase LpxI [Deltaproteobacteria bacterium]